MPKGKKRTLEQWNALFELHQSSGLSTAEFCRRNNIQPKTFSARKVLWKNNRRLRRKSKGLNLFHCRQ